MFQRDYLMNLLMQFFRALLRSREIKRDENDPELAAKTLEDAISNALEMDATAILALDPASAASILQVSGCDPNVMQFVARSLLVEASYLEEFGAGDVANLRRDQAKAIAGAYGFYLPTDLSSFESMTEGLQDAAEAGGFEDRGAAEGFEQ